MRAILITGATGSLGSEILHRVSAWDGDVICLVRAASTEEAHERIRPFLSRKADIGVVAGDLTQPLCGLSPDVIASLRGRIGSILHCAASVAFIDAEKAETTNIVGVRHVLEVADALEVSEFRHVSTAYVAGDAPYFDETDFDKGQTWRNCYERSKHIGEKIVRDWAARDPQRRYDIFRPSILVGGGEGALPAVDPYFNGFKPFAVVAEKMRQLPRSKLPEGVAIDEDGVITLPVVIHIPSSATLNLTPIDWAADRIAAILRTAPANQTYHLVHPSPVNMVWLWHTTMRSLGIMGARTAETPEEKAELVAAFPPALARLQRFIEGGVAAYLPYVIGHNVFADTLTREAMQDAYALPPDIDETYINRILALATRTI